MSIIPSDGQSPFDAIRRVRDDGSEYWSARELMPLLGYKKWERFADAAEQARIVIEAEHGALAAEREASRCREAFGRTRQVGDNVHLSRRASYLTAMRGDSRKPEIRAALLYFAEKTREAETAQPRPFLVPASFADALELAARQAREIEQLEATNEKLAERATVADQYETNPGISPTEFHKVWFPQVRHTEFFEHLYRRDYLIDQRNARWDKRRQEWRDGPHHMWPTAKGKRYFYLHPQIDSRGFRREQTLVIPGEAELDLVAALEREGLPSRFRPALPGADVVRLPRQFGRGDAS